MSGAEVQQLQQSLLRRFSQRAKLEQALCCQLDLRLNEIASEYADLEDTLFRVIQWAEREGRIPELRSLLPLHLAGEKRDAAVWHAQAERLERAADVRVFGEQFRLRQLHIDLCGCHEEAYRATWAASPQKRHVVVDVSAYLHQWASPSPAADLADDTARRDLLVITGDPGSGKSSLARIFAADQARSGRPVLFVPLHYYPGGGDLRQGLAPVLEQVADPCLTGALEHATGERDLLLVLDGLDELAYADHVGTELAQALVAHVKTWLRQAEGRRPVQVLLTGRIPVVQALAGTLPDRTRVIELLPLGPPWPEGPDFHDPHRLLEEDRRRVWWQRYAAAVRSSTEELLPEEIPPRLLAGDLGRITQVPLLCLLGARWWRTSSEPEREGPVNRNRIFQAILQDVYTGEHNQRKSPVVERLGLTQSQYEEALEDIALAVWQQGGRLAPVEAVCQHLERGSRAAQWLQATLQGTVDTGLLEFILAFFFRREGVGKHHTGSLEFTHKQFSEYLVGRRLTRAVEEVHAGLTRKMQPQAEAGALEDWAKLFGGFFLTPEIFQFVHAEFKLRQRVGNPVENWAASLGRLLSASLDPGIPLTAFAGLTTHAAVRDAGLAAETALLAAFDACKSTGLHAAGAGMQRSALQFVEDNGSSSLRRWLGALLLAAGKTVVRQSLRHLVLSHVNLQGANLFRANLEGADLTLAHLEGADLQGVNLIGANLQGANLTRANLQGAHLEGANLQGANLQGVNLIGAKLEGADLQGVNLIGADLIGANLFRANLQGANLTRANLQGADLTRARLIDANLEGTDLRDTLYNAKTRWPSGFAPAAAGARWVSEAEDAAEDVSE